MSNSARPPFTDPVNEAAWIRGSWSAATPASCPWTRANDPLRSAGPGQRRGDDLGDLLREPGVTRMGLDHDGAAGRQRRGGVTTGDAEGEGEVARGEDQHRSYRGLHPPDVGTCAHRPVGVGVVHGGCQPGAIGQQLGEQPQLERGALQLAAQSRFSGQVALLSGQRHQLLSARVERVGHGLQPRSALTGLGRGHGVGRPGGSVQPAFQLLGSGVLDGLGSACVGRCTHVVGSFHGSSVQLRAALVAARRSGQRAGEASPRW